MKIEFSIKSGTGGHYDYDGCDLWVASIETKNIPRIDEEVRVGDRIFLVRNVLYTYTNVKNCDNKYNEYITVYVIPI